MVLADLPHCLQLLDHVYFTDLNKLIENMAHLVIHTFSIAQANDMKVGFHGLYCFGMGAINRMVATKPLQSHQGNRLTPFKRNRQFLARQISEALSNNPLPH